MERVAGIIIILGTLLWLFSIIFLEGRWQWQMFAALVLTIGIFLRGTSGKSYETLTARKSQATDKSELPEASVIGQQTDDFLLVIGN